jgi:hypothetical protein
MCCRRKKPAHPGCGWTVSNLKDMKKQKTDIVDKLALWASGKTQIKRLVIFNVTNDLQSPPGRNPEIQIELLHSQQGDPVFLSEPWLNEINFFPPQI